MKQKTPEPRRLSQPPAEMEPKGGVKRSLKKAPLVERPVMKLTFAEQKELNADILKYASKKKWEVVEEILKRGGKPSERDIFLYTAATYAAEAGKTEILELMVKQGFWFSINDGAARAAYIKALANGHTSAVKLILRSGDFVDGMEKRNFTPEEQDRIMEFIVGNLLD